MSYTKKVKPFFECRHRLGTVGGVIVKMIPNLIVATLVVLGVGACKEAQLGGPITNADIFIDLLTQPGASFQKQKTS